MTGADRSFAAAQRAHDLADDDAQRTARCSHCGHDSDEGTRFGEDEPTQERGDQRVCIECAREIDLDAEADEPADESTPQPIGACRSCGAPHYTAEGFCGRCHPER